MSSLRRHVWESKTVRDAMGQALMYVYNKALVKFGDESLAKGASLYVCDRIRSEGSDAYKDRELTPNGTYRYNYKLDLSRLDNRSRLLGLKKETAEKYSRYSSEFDRLVGISNED